MQVYVRDGWRCWYCGMQVRLHDPRFGPHLQMATVDHLIPKSKGGSNDLANLVTACHGCNSAKGARTVEEYREALRFHQRPEGEAVRLLRQVAAKVNGTPFDVHVFDLIAYLDSQIPPLTFAGEQASPNPQPTRPTVRITNSQPTAGGLRDGRAGQVDAIG